MTATMYKIPDTVPAYPQVTRAGEILSVLVEWNRHHAVCGVKSLLHTVAVVDVNVNVEDSLVISGREKVTGDMNNS